MNERQVRFAGAGSIQLDIDSETELTIIIHQSLVLARVQIECARVTVCSRERNTIKLCPIRQNTTSSHTIIALFYWYLVEA